MKIIKCLGICLLAILASVGFGSCSSDDEYSSRLRELILKDMTFEANEEDGPMSRTTSFRNEDLSNYLATPDASWCHVSIDVAKSQMTVSVDENNSYGERVCVVTMTDVKAPEISRTFKVTQKQNNVIRVSKNNFEVETDGGEFSFVLEYNVNDYEIECDVDWVAVQTNRTRALSKKTITFSVKKNDSGLPRRGVITISSNSTYDPIDVTIYQEYEEKEYFILVKDYYEVDELGGNVSISAQTNKTRFDIWEPADAWAQLGELESFTELKAITQHVNVAPFTDKVASRSTSMYIDEYEVTITQYRNLYIRESGISMLRQETSQLSIYRSDDFDVKWSSSDESVAKVDANGLVTGVGAGTATITVTSSNGRYKDSVPVTIEKPEDLRDYLNVEWQPYFDGNDVESLACTLNNDSKYNIQLTKCEIYSDLKMLSYLDYNEKSGALKAGDSKKATFDNLKGKGSKFGFTVVWYYLFNGEKFTYRCEYMP